MRSHNYMVRSILTWGSRRCAMLFVVLLCATAAQADPYDATAAAGELQVVCKDFAIDSGVLSAKCNKVGTGGLIGLVDASIDLEIDQRCWSGATITVTNNAVTLKGDCEVPLGAEAFSLVETDINNHIEWIAGESKFSWKTGTPASDPWAWEQARLLAEGP